MASGDVTNLDVGGGLSVIQLHTPGLGDHSYVLRSGDEVAVIDPQRDLDRLEGLLRLGRDRLVAVLETHVHNDYVSGGPVLRDRHGAAYAVPAGAGFRTRHRPLADDDEVPVGAVRLRARATPGHTPHHMSYEIVAGDTVRGVFSGGCLLVGTCGRTDLVAPELTEELTRQQYRSAQGIGSLGDATAVAPTHGAGSFCASGASGAGTWSTVGQERGRNPAFLAASEDEFVHGQLQSLAAYPSYYAHMAELNRRGAPVFEAHPPPMLSAEAFGALAADAAVVVDGRPRRHFAAGHVPGAVNIELDSGFATYVGWLLPFGTRLALVLAPDQDPTEAVRQCARIGIESIAGVLAGGMEGWTAGDRPRRAYRVTDVDGLYRAFLAGEGRILDVRQDQEWADGHVPGALHIHVPDVASRLGLLRSGPGPVYVYCQSGQRSAMAASRLAAAGIDPVLVDGGFPDWVERGFPVEG